MKTSPSNLPYIKINTSDKMINTNLNSTNDSNNNILNSTFRQSKKLINRIQPYTSNKKEHLKTNLSTSSLTNQTFTYYKDKFLSSLYNDIHKKKFINSLKKNQKNEDLINIINDSQKEAVKINNDIGNDTYVHNFLNQNISSNRWFKLIPKHLINFGEKENNNENVYSRNSKVFKIKKKIVFEKEIVHLSVYDNFDNYKKGKYNKNNIVRIQDYIDKTNNDDFGFHTLRKIGLNKALIKKGERNSNGNTYYSNHEEEKKDTVITIINNDNTKEYIKNRLTKSKKMDMGEGPSEKIIFDDTRNLKKIIMRNRIKNRSQRNFKDFDTYDQKNKKIISILNEKLKQKSKDKNNSIEKDMKLFNLNYNLYNRMNKMNKLSSRIDVISHRLNNINRKLDGYLYKVKHSFDKDAENIFS